MSHLFELNIDHWHSTIENDLTKIAMQALEKGKVIYLPKLSFLLENDENILFDRSFDLKRAKNISFDHKKNRMGGIDEKDAHIVTMTKMIKRYHESSTTFLKKLCPNYESHHASGRTSFRPIEIMGRKPTSYRKDDTRLHVDAFPSTPVNDLRILRIFTNINPYDESRFWRLGESFQEVIQQFLPKVRRMLPFEADFLSLTRLTRKKRHLYDHCMLQIHNRMKKDMRYQQNVKDEKIAFPPGSTWIVFTDIVSHAATQGRYVLEQTFYPSIDKMHNPDLSPQRQIQNKY
jgi:hypothetical protein